MSLRLSVETAGETVGVALAADGEVLTSAWVTTRAASSELVMSMVGDALSQTNTNREDVTELIGCRGPGSFTGIRVGLATLRGLSLALDTPLRTLTAFEVEVAAAPEGAGPLFVAIDARRGQLYAQLFGPADSAPERRAVGDAAIVDPTADALRAMAGEGARDTEAPSLLGSGVARYPDVFTSAFPAARMVSATRPRVEALVRAASWGWGTDATSPFYLRPPDAKLPRDAPR